MLAIKLQFGGAEMKISELFSDVITEDLTYEYKAILNPDKPVKWAKTIVGYANGEGGIMFVGVSNDGEAFGIDLNEIDNTKNLIAKIIDRHIFPHTKVQYMMRSVDSNAERFVLAVKVNPADSVVRYREGDFNETVYIKGDGNTTPATPEDIILCLKENMVLIMKPARSYMRNQNGVNISLYARNIERVPMCRL